MSPDKFRWLQDESEINGDNLNNVRHEASRNFGINRGNSRKKKLKRLQTTGIPRTIEKHVRNTLI
jgi:hypothetical protein